MRKNLCLLLYILFLEASLSERLTPADLEVQRSSLTCFLGPRCINGYRRRLVCLRKRSLPFLTIDATIDYQTCSLDRCNIFPGLSYNKTNNTLLNSVKRNDVEAQVELSFKFTD